MNTTPSKNSGGGSTGFAIAGFVLLGVLLGGLLGFALAPHNADRKSPDPQRRTMAYVTYPFELFLQASLSVVGASIGGAIGGVVGAKLARGAAEPSQSPSASAGAIPNDSPCAEVAGDLPLSPTDEIPRIERAIAHLQTRLETLKSDPPPDDGTA